MSLRVLFINCTLKRSPEQSHTQGLADISIEIMRRQGVTVDVVRAIDHDIATGVWPDMTEHGWERDDWPAIFEQVDAAHILVLCTPIWLGLHLARMITDAGGIPVHGNQRSEWDAGCRFDFPNPEHR